MQSNVLLLVASLIPSLLTGQSGAEDAAVICNSPKVESRSIVLMKSQLNLLSTRTRLVQAELVAVSKKIDVALSLLQNLVGNNMDSQQGRDLESGDIYPTKKSVEDHVLTERVTYLENQINQLRAMHILPKGDMSVDTQSARSRSIDSSTRINMTKITPQEFKNFTAEVENKISQQFERKLEKVESSFKGKFDKIADEQRKMSAKIEKLLSDHEKDTRKLTSYYNKTLGHIQDHAEDQSLHKSDQSYAVWPHNESLSALVSDLQQQVQELAENQNETAANSQHIEELVKNVTEAMAAEHDLIQSRQGLHIEEFRKAQQQISQTLAYLTSNFTSRDLLQSAHLEQLRETLRSLSVEVERHEHTYPPIPEGSIGTIAMFAALRRNFTSGEGNSLIPDEVYDVNNAYSPSTGRFQPSSTSGGLVFHSLTSSNIGSINFHLRNASDYIASALGENNQTAIDVNSRDVIIDRSPLFLDTSGGGFLCGNSLMPTSWTALGISSSMKRVIAFSLVRTSVHYGPASPLSFNKILTSVGGGLSSGMDTFTAPVTGIYLLSVSFNRYFNRKFQVALMRGSTQLFSFGRHFTEGTNVDTLSKTTLAKLTAGDRIFVNLYGSHTAVYAGPRGWQQPSFSGFLYDPLHMAPIAWSVVKNTSINDISTGHEVLHYEKVNLNQGETWNGTANEMVAPLAGYYYVHVSAGALPGKPVHLYVNINGQPFVDLWRSVGWQAGVDHLSRSALLRLRAGDKVQITAARGTGVYSDSGFQTAFCGFLAYRES